ncbi:MAG: diphthine--ammonia ligase [Thaumarchaeota archaeon]|nr:diphthine--ammonia ligase [Candidatus Calditenuaceae archaeon]
MVALYTGGKDSTLALEKALHVGHEVVELLTVVPEPHSYAFHDVCLEVTPLQARSMGLSQRFVKVPPGKGKEVEALGSHLESLSESLGIEGVVSGVIRSSYQKYRMDALLSEIGLSHLTPNWGMSPGSVVAEVVRRGYEVLISSVSANGLNSSWVGRKIDSDALRELMTLSERFGFDPDGEGGDYETLVLWAPLFRERLKLLEWTTTWDGYSGRLLIGRAELDP